MERSLLGSPWPVDWIVWQPIVRLADRHTIVGGEVRWVVPPETAPSAETFWDARVTVGEGDHLQWEMEALLALHAPRLIGWTGLNVHPEVLPNLHRVWHRPDPLVYEIPVDRPLSERVQVHVLHAALDPGMPLQLAADHVGRDLTVLPDAWAHLPDRRIPYRYVKLDPVLVHRLLEDPDAYTWLTAYMAALQDMEDPPAVIAVGVDQPVLADLLHACGVEYAEGWLFRGPVRVQWLFRPRSGVARAPDGGPLPWAIPETTRKAIVETWGLTAVDWAADDAVEDDLLEVGT